MIFVYNNASSITITPDGLYIETQFGAISFTANGLSIQRSNDGS